MLGEFYVCQRCGRDLSANLFSQRVSHVKACSAQAPILKPAAAAEAKQKSAVASAECATAGTVHEWLQVLGLAHWAGTFTQEEIDMDLLPTLTDSDLMAIGIAGPTDRTTILRAAQALATSSPGADSLRRTASAPVAQAPAGSSGSAADSKPKRQKRALKAPPTRNAEALQLAKALSASMATADQKAGVAGRRQRAAPALRVDALRDELRAAEETVLELKRMLAAAETDLG
ncbi:hypothetical protein WJX72_002277 [[Myrmecia] bisecta]|uniref:SAM domain-containing protein n=1 Tax=[Myrmecia] bisecta TaxID=41462 RepID=A0AAW1PNG0_9CHLO